MSFVDIANLKGPMGKRGPQGLPGAEGVPTDEAVAILARVPSETRSTLEDLYATGVSVKLFGAVGDGVVDDAPAIQEALDGGHKTVYFPPGTYRCGSELRVYEGTDIWLDDAATILHDGETYLLFVNGPSGDTNYATGYDGDGDITVRGGTMDLSLRALHGSTIALNFAHADGIRIEGVKFVGGAGNSHYIEINSSRNVTIVRNRFSGWDAQSYTDREAINIDHAGPVGFPAFGAWDGTTCDNVLVEGNVFEDVQVAVGNHAGDVTTQRHTNIRVLNNTMRRMGQYAVRALGWGRGSTVAGNTIVECHGNAIRCEKAEDVLVMNNTLDGVALVGEAPAVWMSAATRCKVLGNRISNDGWPTNYTFAVSMNAASTQCEVDTSGMSRGVSGIVNDSNTSFVTIDGTISADLDDDTVLRLPFPGYAKQGLVMVSMNSAAAYSPRGIYWGRADGDLALVPIADAASTGRTVTTGDLTGVTGPDGGITLSVFNGDFLVENRAGVNRKINVQFLAG